MSVTILESENKYFYTIKKMKTFTDNELKKIKFFDSENKDFMFLETLQKETKENTHTLIKWLWEMKKLKLFDYKFSQDNTYIFFKGKRYDEILELIRKEENKK